MAAVSPCPTLTTSLTWEPGLGFPGKEDSRGLAGLPHRHDWGSLLCFLPRLQLGSEGA